MKFSLDRFTGGKGYQWGINGKCLRIITVLRVEDPISIFNSIFALFLFQLQFVFNFQLICPHRIPQQPARAPVAAQHPTQQLFSSHWRIDDVQLVQYNNIQKEFWFFISTHLPFQSFLISGEINGKG